MTTGVSIFGDDSGSESPDGDYHEGSDVVEARKIRAHAVSNAVKSTGVRGGGKTAFSDSKQKGLFNAMKNDFTNLSKANKLSSKEISEAMNSVKGGSKTSSAQVRTWLSGQRSIPQKHTGTFVRAYQKIMEEKGFL